MCCKEELECSSVEMFFFGVWFYCFRQYIYEQFTQYHTVHDIFCTNKICRMYGPLTVPGDFLPRGRDAEEVAQFLPRLRQRPPVSHSIKPPSVPAALADSEVVFVRQTVNARQRPPLAPPYEGPYSLEGLGTRKEDVRTRLRKSTRQRQHRPFIDPMTPFEAARRAPRTGPLSEVAT